MTSRVWVWARSRPSPPLYPHFNRPSGFWPCVKSCLVEGSDKYTVWHSCRTEHCPSKADSSPEGPWLCQGDLRANEMHYWHLCIALDLVVQFKIKSSLRVWILVQLGSLAHIAPSEPMTCLDQQGFSLGSGPTFPSPNPYFNPTFGSFDLVLIPVCWDAETNMVYLYLWLVGFYGISTLVGYLMPNFVYTYIKYTMCKQIVWR